MNSASLHHCQLKDRVLFLEHENMLLRQQIEALQCDLTMERKFRGDLAEVCTFLVGLSHSFQERVDDILLGQAK